MIDWQPWSNVAFARAAAERRPVLLSITAAWCSTCDQMERTTYADPDVVSLVTDGFVAVRVDSDRRPDINERYNLGGWPTTAFLSSSGDLLAGGTFIAPEQMRAVLRKVAAAMATGGAAMSPEQPAAFDGAVPSLDDLVEETFRTFDAEHGGFGTGAKFPLTAPVHLALLLSAVRADDRWVPVADRTLDAIAEGALRDAASGAYFRYSASTDWHQPVREVLLDTNAALLAAFVDAHVTRGRAVDRDRAADLAQFILQNMTSPFGGFRGSQPDETVYLDANAAALSALLGAAAVLEDSSIARDALSAFERVLLACYRPGAGVAHYYDGEARLRGLLADQVAAIAALLDAFALTGEEPYRMMAEELAHTAVRVLWDDRGGFRDRAGSEQDVGLLKRIERPFVGNCDAARAFRRLAATSGELSFAEHSAGALSAAAAKVSGQGPLTAHYLLAVLHPASG